ncbi:hypothetical protein FXN57_02065 [Aggregatibacter actinomycetemcomitans]|nr:hypothetical protein FXN57_02065 [Aggregatibacter actinomycetemcomitans]
MFITVASPALSLSGNHANITIKLIMQDAQPTLNCPCNATPCDNTVQGAELKSESNSKPSPMMIRHSRHSAMSEGFIEA